MLVLIFPEPVSGASPSDTWWVRRSSATRCTTPVTTGRQEDRMVGRPTRRGRLRRTTVTRDSGGRGRRRGTGHGRTSRGLSGHRKDRDGVAPNDLVQVGGRGTSWEGVLRRDWVVGDPTEGTTDLGVNTGNRSRRWGPSPGRGRGRHVRGPLRP